jgi:hypothetical protein
MVGAEGATVPDVSWPFTVTSTDEETLLVTSVAAESVTVAQYQVLAAGLRPVKE